MVVGVAWARAGSILLVVGTALLVSTPARADTPVDRSFDSEVAAVLGLGVTQLDTGGGPAFRLGIAAVHWVKPWLGVGAEGLGFNNIASLASDNIACQRGQPCYSGDPRNRSGWLADGRLFVGTELWIVRLYAAVGAGIAHEDIPVTPSQGYWAASGVLELGSSFHLSHFSLVPALRFDDIDGSLSFLAQLGLGANF
jgi:hypothetical protein